MEKLFGLSMTTIAGCLGSALALVLAVLALVAWRRPVMFKLGLRPIPRRRAQSALIVFGLMLASLIITAAFGFGDTFSYTIRSLVVEALGEIDEIVRVGGGNADYGWQNSQDPYFKLARFEALSAQLADYPLVDAVIPSINENLPAVNTTRRQSLRSLSICQSLHELKNTHKRQDDRRVSRFPLM